YLWLEPADAKTWRRAAPGGAEGAFTARTESQRAALAVAAAHRLEPARGSVAGEPGGEASRDAGHGAGCPGRGAPGPAPRPDPAVAAHGQAGDGVVALPIGAPDPAPAEARGAIFGDEGLLRVEVGGAGPKIDRAVEVPGKENVAGGVEGRGPHAA